VKDDGVGIANDMLPYIFDLFVQSPRALDRRYGGLGVGLTLVQRLVQLHDGSVEARSEGLGRGSEFIVRLPVAPSGTTVRSTTRATLAPEKSRRILIVDDNVDSAQSMATLQRLRGHEIRCAFTGAEAVSIAADFAPEVVLLDIGLPGMDGYEVARRLRAMPTLAGTFIVATTGYGGSEDRANAKEAGFDEYLIKPVDLELLREWLRSRAEDTAG
jgi:two-component system CheB/CheR fusion protein